jgi:hypothetical protein
MINQFKCVHITENVYNTFNGLITKIFLSCSSDEIQQILILILINDNMFYK